MNRKRRYGFGDFGGLKWTVVQEREGDVDAYLRWVLGQRQFNAAPHQNPSLQAREAQAGGLKNSPRNKKNNAKNRTT